MKRETDYYDEQKKKETGKCGRETFNERTSRSSEKNNRKEKRGK